MNYPLDSQFQSHIFLLLKAGEFWCSDDVFFQMFHLGWVVDARAGGYVVGRRHSEGNIYMIQKQNDQYVIPGHLEGGEFMIPATVYEANKSRIEEINSDTTDVDDEVELTFNFDSNLRIINTVGYPFDKLMFIDPRNQFIVNRKSTKKHFNELCKMIAQNNDLLLCNLDELVKKD